MVEARGAGSCVKVEIGFELGCGTGLFWASNARRIPPGWRPILSDLSDGMLRETRHNLAAIVARACLLQCDAQALPFRDATFDGLTVGCLRIGRIDQPVRS